MQAELDKSTATRNKLENVIRIGQAHRTGQSHPRGQVPRGDQSGYANAA